MQIDKDHMRHGNSKQTLRLADERRESSYPARQHARCKEQTGMWMDMYHVNPNTMART